MQAKPQNHVGLEFAVSRNSIGGETGCGMMGGLAATVVMDLLLVSSFIAAGMPPFTCFSIVGDTIISLFSTEQMANNALLGVAAHYSIGPVLGAIFGAAGMSVPALRVGSWKKAVLFAVLYAEIVSQPLLALTPIFLRMSVPDALLWYGGSLVMHLIWGCVLGFVWSLGRRLHAAVDPI